MTAAAAAQLPGRPGPGQARRRDLGELAAMRPGYFIITNME